MENEMKVNPTTVTWTAPTQYTDGTAFGAADFAGYEWAISSPDPNDAWQPLVAVPVTFDVTTLDISLLDIPENTEWELAMRTVARNGAVSEWAVANQTILFDVRVPNAPLGFSVA